MHVSISLKNQIICSSTLSLVDKKSPVLSSDYNYNQELESLTNSLSYPQLLFLFFLIQIIEHCLSTSEL